MYFSIAAPQQVILPDGRVLSFRVNGQDSSLCEIHVIEEEAGGVAGTHILTFKRNGGPQDTAFAATPQIEPAPPVAPLEGYKSVDDDAVRTDKAASLNLPKGAPVDAKPAA